MNDDRILSRAIFEALSDLNWPLDISRVSMWSLSDRYAAPPFFRFKINDANSAILYEKLKAAIESSKGSLKWSIYRLEAKYFIMPDIFYEPMKSHNHNRDFLISLYGEDKYKALIDMAINDVANLANNIRRLRR